MSAIDTTGLQIPGSGDTTTQSSEFDIAFPTIPVVDDPSPPTLVIRTNDLADFAEDSLPDSQAFGGQVPGDTDILFDWDVNEPAGIADGATFTWVSDIDYLVQWFGKALETPRGRYPIYGSEYGSGLQELIGSGLPDPTFSSEVARDVVRCGTFHPRITGVTVLGIRREPIVDRLALLIDVSLILDTNEDPVTVTMRY
jgi:phage baseplate assembly protein W